MAIFNKAAFETQYLDVVENAPGASDPSGIPAAIAAGIAGLATCINDNLSTPAASDIAYTNAVDSGIHTVADALNYIIAHL